MVAARAGCAHAPTHATISKRASFEAHPRISTAKTFANEKSTVSRPLILLLVAFVANALAALSGGGVGLIQLPMLLFLGLPYPRALATHKVASVALGAGAGTRYLRSGLIERRFALLILLSGLPGVVLGSLVVLAIPEAIIRTVLGVLTISLGLYSVFRRDLGQSAEARHRDRAGLIVGAIGLFVIGFLNGSVTSGTGLFCTLWLVRWFGFDYKAAVAYTLTLVGLGWNTTGAVTLGAFGVIQWSWLPWLVAGALAGSYTGAHFALASPNRWIKRAFEVITVGIGARLLF